MMKCGVCGDLLAIYPRGGYLHSDGSLYKQRQVPCNDPKVRRVCEGASCRRCLGMGMIWIDDHAVLPVPA